VFVHQDDPALGGLPAPGEPVFYPKVGHCVYRGVTEDRAAPGKKLVELEDLEEGSRILIPTERVPNLGLRPAGRSLDEIQQELSSEFEPSSEDAGELDIDALINDGSPRNLAKGLKRLHLLRQTTGLSREEEQTRRKIRSWLAAEVALSKDCTRAEAQAFITRILQETMNAHRRKEREEAKERRRQVKAQKAAEDAGTQQGSLSGTLLDQPGPPLPERVVDESEASAEPPEPVEATSEEHASSPNEAAPSSDTEETDTAVQVPPVEPPLQNLLEEASPEEDSEPTESAAPTEFDDSSEASSSETRVDSDPTDRESAESS
jgi:RNA polymerase-interacting CarD/CdnL/TRCF family regulator